jgi:protein TonB
MTPMSASRSFLNLWRTDYLPIALLLSVAAHIALVVIQFANPPSQTPPSPRALEIALVNTRTETAPVQPQLIAQHDLYGGGEQKQGVASTPLPRTATESPDEVVLAALRKRQMELEAEQQSLLTQLVAQERTRSNPKPDNDQLDGIEPGSDDLDQESVVLSAQISALKERVQRYNEQPRRQFVGPSAKASIYAEYLEAWRQKIELIGTEHYPAEARGRIYGSLQMTVHIRADGSVQRIDIDRPSSEPILNLAAQRIIQLSAPFPPFPSDLARETSILAITRTWNFINEQLETSVP